MKLKLQDYAGGSEIDVPDEQFESGTNRKEITFPIMLPGGGAFKRATVNHVMVNGVVHALDLPVKLFTGCYPVFPPGALKVQR